MLDDGISIGNIGRLKTIQPDLKVLVISNYNSDQFGQKAITMGADGYIEKKAPIVELVKAITTVMEDEEMYFKKELLYNIAFGGKQNRTLHNPFDLLSKQEFAIAVLLLQSKTRKEIATELNIRENTVSMHKASILEKLKINGVLALRELARYHNITTKK
jgi:DNA-binding NarL/FixJ family response regulator